MAVESGTYTPETIARKQKMADLLLQQSLAPQPIVHWTQGLAQMGKALAGGLIGDQADREKQAADRATSEAMLRYLQPANSLAPSAEAAPGQVGPAPAAPQTPPGPTPPAAAPPSVQEVKPEQFNSIDAMASPPGKFDPNYQPMLSAASRAVSKIESGSPEGNYQAVGPITETGDRAYGRHQVMGKNIPVWTKEVLGKAMTPQEFLADKDAQDAVFNAKFGQSAQKFGTPQDAASVWFSGKPLAAAGNRQDITGTTVPQYVSNFTRNMGAVPNVAAALNGQPNDMPGQPNFAQRFDANAGPAGVVSPIAQALNQPSAAPGSPAAVPGMATPQGTTPNAPASPPADNTNAKIAALLRSDNRSDRALGNQLAVAAMQASIKEKPEFIRLNDEQVMNKHTAQVYQAGPGFRPLITPQERAQHGIPADDNRPYQVGPGNKLQHPPAESRMTVDQRGQMMYAQTNEKHFAELNHAIPKAANDARGQIATLSRMSQLLADPTINTGAGAEMILDLKRLAKTAGIDVGDLGGAEAVRSIGNKFALELRNPNLGAGMPGAMSDQDRKFLQSIPPGLERTPEGSKIIGEYLTRLAQRNLEIEKLRQTYVKQHKSLDDGFYQVVGDYAEKNPLFPEAVQKKNAPPSAAPTTTAQSGPTLQEIEAEINRRKLAQP